MTTALCSVGRAVYVNYQYKKNKEEIDLINEYTEKIILVSHNCFSWAREKLGMLDEKIVEELGEKPFEKLGILPIWYLPNKQ